ncbi:MAG: hypothetical protein O7B26_13620 [Planctomycetota bacterium]|nr:hypothetical protein [Planctomycetota bacterium]
MSRRKSAKKSHQKPSAESPGLPSEQTSWVKTILLMVLASVITLVVHAQLTGRRSMLSAIVKTEYLQLAQDKPARQTGRAQRGSWSDVLQAFASMRRGSAVGGRHEAVFRMLQLLQPRRSRVSLNQSDVDTARSYLQADPDNLTSRMAFAAIDLTVRTSEPDRTGSALDRYEAIRSVIEGSRPTEVATLYNDDLTRLAHKAVKPHVSRPDVALSLAESGRLGIPKSGHYGAFKSIQQRITELAGELRAEGHDSQAHNCQRWVARWLMGVLDSEPDASTRLLCADLLARSIQENESVADDLRRMRTDFHRKAEAAPLDYAEQSTSPLPCFAPAEYRSAFRWMVASWSLTLSAIGGFIVFGFACVVSIGARVFNRRRREFAVEKRRPFHLVLIGALIPSMASCGLALVHLYDAGLPSMDWGVTGAALVVVTGALATIALTGGSIVATAENRGRRRATAFLAIVTGLFLLIPPIWITKGCRVLDAWIGAPIVIGIVLSILLIVAARFSPGRFRTLAACAAVFWCVNISAAFVVIQKHRAADRRYQAAVVSAHADEMGARLGPDWQETYLASTRRLLRDGFE